MKEVKQAVGDFTVIANTGVNVKNIGDILNIVDGCFVATSVKVEGEADKKVDLQKVKNLMKAKREKN
jgi:predicted TIM-barrel enzyme